jgi:hypothetical protein
LTVATHGHLASIYIYIEARNVSAQIFGTSPLIRCDFGKKTGGKLSGQEKQRKTSGLPTNPVTLYVANSLSYFLFTMIKNIRKIQKT